MYAIRSYYEYGLIVLIFYSLLFGFAFALYIIISFTTSVFAKHLDAGDNEETADDSTIGKQ